ncbi:MAG: methyltransferase [Oscillospiraceae bacterium]|nr:methyltransferase [Oscillospiraceae bacterium]
MEGFEIFEIGDLKLFVSRTHRFGTDAVELADFTEPKNGQVICDLCTGCGIIPFLLISKSGSACSNKIYALDIDPEAMGLLRDSIKANSLEKLIFPVHEDLKNITSLPVGSMDLVTVNPPYYKADDGFKRENGGNARHELLCRLDDVTGAAARLLKYGGRLKMCHIPERLTDVVCSLRKHNLEPKIIKFIAHGENQPRLMLIDAKKGGKPKVKIQLTINT